MARSASVFARCACLLAAVGMLLNAASAAAASLSGRDVQIIVKALGFLEPAPQGGLVAVIYAPGNTASRADADAIVSLFGTSLLSNGGSVTARAIDAASFGDGAAYVAIILAAGMENAGTTPLRHGLLSITAADDLVKSGRCVMAVHSQPRVDITVNRAAAQAAGVGFTAAFGMLVHEE